MTISWTGASDSFWWNASNWSDPQGVWISDPTQNVSVLESNFVPQTSPSDPIIISGTVSTPVIVNYVADPAHSSLESTQLSSLQVDSYATLYILNPYMSGTVFSVKSLTIGINGTVNINSSGTVALGESPTVNGTLHITNTTVTTTNYSITGSGLLIIDNASLGSAQAFMQLGHNLTTNLINNATLFMNTAQVNGTVHVDGSANHLVFTDYRQIVATPITGYNANTVITIESAVSVPQAATWTLNSNQTYTINIALDSSGSGITLTNVSFATPPSGTSGTLAITKNSDGNWDVSEEKACFLAGSMIRTPTGEITVETLRSGDKISGFDPVSGKETVLTIMRTARNTAYVRSNTAREDSDHPVRIVADAISDGIPTRDLLVTAEHCLFLDGSFVPVRMLVNERSISYDTTFSAYDYFHIEVEPHAIIVANGVLTESYLDTGHHVSFGSDTIVALQPPTKTWASDAAVPLDVSRAFVEPLFRQLERRAIEAGIELHHTQPPVTNDPDLHIVGDNGRILHPVRRAAGHLMFMVPSTMKVARLVSRSSSPSDTVGPFVDDRRSLGVLIGKMCLFNPKTTEDITRHLCDAELSGWHGLEDGACRWTAGNAVLPLPEREQSAMSMLSIEVLAAGPYRVQPDIVAAAATA